MRGGGEKSVLVVSTIMAREEYGSGVLIDVRDLGISPGDVVG